MSADRRKRVVTRQDEDRIHEEHIVEDPDLENRQMVRKVTQFIWLMFGILEALIGFRIFLKIIAANQNNWFTAFVYRFTDAFLWPFQNIVENPSFQGAVLEITSFIAIIVYALLAWVIVRLVWLVFYQRSTRSVTVYDKEE